METQGGQDKNENKAGKLNYGLQHKVEAPTNPLSPLKGQCRQLKEMENDRMQSAAKLRLSANCTTIALVAPERGDVAQRQRGL